MDLGSFSGSTERGTEIDDVADETTARARLEALKARARASEEGEVVKQRLGKRMVDLMEEYFPEEMAARRREDAGRAFAAGLVVGFAVRSLLKRR